MEKMLKISGVVAFLLGLIAIVTLALQGPAYQAGWWGLMPVFTVGFKIAVLAGGLAAVFALLHVITSLFTKKRIAGMALIGLVFGICAAAVPLQMKRIGSSVPAIHDITTDTKTPPEFVAIAPLRAQASNPLTYDPKIAEQQAQAYPDLKTVLIDAKADEVFTKALATIDTLGWELVAEDRNSGRIEATETTRWFGFKDDIVIRIAQSGGKTYLDARSKSRVGRSDLGANAKRLREFKKELLESL